MSIADVIAKAGGRAGHWRVTREEVEGVEVADLWHYSTRMLRWNVNDPADQAVLDYSTGHGSVSDQGGMNQAFRLLGLPLYFSRAGGADILELGDPELARRMPHYLWSRGTRSEISYTDTDARKKRLEALGREIGTGAGSWIVDGNTSDQTAREILRMIVEGDPALEYPAPLSGEFSGDVLAADVLAHVDSSEGDPAAEDMLDVFEQAYRDAWYAEVERSCWAVLR